MSKKEFIILLFIAVALLTRFIFLVDGMSVLPNFTAVGAIAIFGAVHFKGLKKWIIPLVVLWASDIILNNVVYAQYYDHFQIMGSLWVYGSFILIGLLAYFILQKASWLRLIITAIGGGVIFFLITNFGVWLGASAPYTKDLAGLIECYTAGLPFFRNTILANIIYSFMLFGAYDLLASRLDSLSPYFLQKNIVQ